MSTNFPTSLDTFVNPQPGDSMATVSHASQHDNINDAVTALQAKVGANSSSVTTSLDYKLSGVTGSDKAVSKTGVETITNKILTSPSTNGGTSTGETFNTMTIGTTPTMALGSDATGDVYYRNSSGFLARLAKATDGNVLTLASGIPSWAGGATGTPVAITSGTGTTLSLTTTTGQRVVVFAKGDTSVGTGTILLNYNSVQKDQVVYSSAGQTSFAMMYTEIPGAATHNITVTGAGISDCVIIAFILG